MDIQLAPVPASTGSGVNDLNHIYCCTPDVALCGTDISGDEDVDYDEANCVVCVDLENTDAPCPRCGFNPVRGS